VWSFSSGIVGCLLFLSEWVAISSRTIKFREIALEIS
jgi:hypothetical protein